MVESQAVKPRAEVIEELGKWSEDKIRELQKLKIAHQDKAKDLAIYQQFTT